MDGTSTKNPFFDKVVFILFLIIVTVGLYLRCYQYLMGRSLWEDEAHIALNFIYFGYIGLTHPLANFQVAPILFLFTEETFSRIFGVGAMSLRAFPFIMSVLTLPLPYYIAQKLTKNKIIGLICLLLYATNLYTVYYSSEIKPYVLEVCVYLIITALILADEPIITRRKYLLLAIIGGLAILYANTSVVLLFCVACYIFYNFYKNKAIDRKMLYVMVVWGVVFTANVLKFVLHHPYSYGMKIEWGDKFCPINIFSHEFVEFIKLRIDDTLFSSLLCISTAYNFQYVLLLIFIAAIGHIIYHKKYTILLFTCMPILLALALSMLKLYPFFYRFILYLLPAFMLLIAIGVYTIGAFIGKYTKDIVGAIIVIVCCCFLIQPSLRDFPHWNREFRPTMNYINDHYKNTKLYITTPYTLYEYYHRTGYVKNDNYQPIKWNLTPEEYYDSVKQQQSNYILLSSACDYDGYKKVLDDLQKRNLVIRRFEYKTYLVSEIKPKTP